MFEIKKNIAKPENAPVTRHPTTAKYPWAEMKSGDCFFVPLSDRREGEEMKDFRGRIVKSAGNWARNNKPEGQERATFSVIIMDHTQEVNGGDGEPEYYEGDIGVWMD